MHIKTPKPAAELAGAGLQSNSLALGRGQQLVEFLGQLLAADALVMALHGSSELALALCSRLFVELACAQFSQQTGFFDAALEAAHGDFEGLVFFKANSGHVLME